MRNPLDGKGLTTSKTMSPLTQAVRELDLVPIVMTDIFIYIWTSVHEEKVLEDKVPKSLLAIFFQHG